MPETSSISKAYCRLVDFATENDRTALDSHRSRTPRSDDTSSDYQHQRTQHTQHANHWFDRSPRYLNWLSQPRSMLCYYSTSLVHRTPDPDQAGWAATSTPLRRSRSTITRSSDNVAIYQARQAQVLRRSTSTVPVDLSPDRFLRGSKPALQTNPSMHQHCRPALSLGQSPCHRTYHLR
jgi:hypothetical protein